MLGVGEGDEADLGAICRRSGRVGEREGDSGHPGYVRRPDMGRLLLRGSLTLCFASRSLRFVEWLLPPSGVPWQEPHERVRS